ncbi:helix-turn-helix domain-containing protein [Devosia sp. 1566]|uniref:winged helix-turn-helix transcriptional regulator n=1 Tax=Devosia sp. 1566 TaxID=2499144 RepID=UPI000FDC4F44|nr:helix-turn-helix domain-containing protein [Devosia sp. 1566]
MTDVLDELPNCAGVGDVLARIGDKWTVQIVVLLSRRPERFNSIKRQVPGISQQMLTRTLKALERDGLVHRAVRNTTPPQVQYSLSEAGMSLTQTARQLAVWAIEHREFIRDSRASYDNAQ